MKPILIIFLILTNSLNGLTQLKKYNYKSKLEPDSKIVIRDYNYTLEKLSDGSFVYKTYYPENKVITSYVSMKSRKTGIKDGLAYTQQDNGTLITKGHYENNKKVGYWIENKSSGEYKAGKKDGIWTTKGDNGITVEQSYLKGKLHGDQFKYDSLGNIALYAKFRMGDKVYERIDTNYYVPFEPPRFNACNDSGLTSDELQTCSNKEMVKFIYSKMEYPKNARKQSIEGIAVANLVIEKDGTISDIKMLNGLSIDIKMECEKVLSLLPDFIPALRGGKPVQAEIKIPLSFKLE